MASTFGVFDLADMLSKAGSKSILLSRTDLGVTRAPPIFRSSRRVEHVARLVRPPEALARTRRNVFSF